MKYQIGEAAAMTGVSIRTLRYYDKIGLLVPAEISEAGYRYYTEREISLLQQILFYRELEFSLEEIKPLLSAPETVRMQALKGRRELLIMKREHIDGLIRLAEETIGGKEMTKPRITTEDMERVRGQYAAEIRSKYGSSEEYAESERRYSAFTSADKDRLAAEQDEIFSAFAKLAGHSPESPEVQELVKRWQKFITANYYPCTTEILAGLGKLYTADTRFGDNLNAYGDGTAEIMSRGIAIYCDRLK